MTTATGILAGKRGLIMGVANDRSIAWGVAKEAHKHGADLAFSYQGESLKKRITPLAESIGSAAVFECDVAQDESIEQLFEQVVQAFGGQIDFVVHSIAFANKDNLRGEFYNTSRSDFSLAMDISCFSFVKVAKCCAKTMRKGGSLVGMSYLGAEKVVGNYNVMGVAKAALECSTRYLATDLGTSGIRVNTISPGPMRTLAASGISGFNKVLDYQEKNSPMRKNVSQEEIGNATVFLLSDLSSGITGENIYVDAGYNIVGIPSSLSEE